MLPKLAFRGYGIDVASTYRHAVCFADKILKGTKPAELAIERASKFQFVLNLEVPAATLLRADEATCSANDPPPRVPRPVHRITD